MKRFVLSCVCATLLLCAWSAAAQSASGTVPQLLNFSGQVLAADGTAKTGPALLTIALYDSQTGGTPLWSEQQAVTLDAQGRYAVILGALTQGGVPVNVFAAGSARWMGITVDAAAEQPRFMLLSVAYALKAADADTVGGKTPSDFVLTTNLTEKVRDVVSGRTGGDGPTTAAIGTANMLQKGNGSGGSTDTVAPVFEDNSGRVGIGTSQPLSRLHILDNSESEFRLQINGGSLAVLRGVAGAVDFGSFSNHPVRLFANSTERIRIDPTGNVGVGTSNPGAKLDVAGDGHMTGNFVVDGNIGAKYQDVAEWVETAAPIDPGSVVIVDPKAHNRVATSARAYDSRVAGAVSPQPGLVLGVPGEGKVLVAQSGRVRIKADARYGAIKVGDLLVTSPTPGYAMRSRPMKVGGQTMHRPGTLLGKALEPLPNGTGQILVLLTLQ